MEAARDLAAGKGQGEGDPRVCAMDRCLWHVLAVQGGVGAGVLLGGAGEGWQHARSGLLCEGTADALS